MSRAPKPSGRKDEFGAKRSESSYGRQPGNRRQPIILIVCEGRRTERRYLDALKAARRIRAVTVKVVPGSDGRSSPSQILDEALRQKKEHSLGLAPGDELWCVFDTEREGTYPDLQDVMARAARAGVQLAVSNPAFEYWYLLHYECTDRPFTDATEVTDQLCGHFPQYTKTMNAFACLKDRTETALANAEALRKRADVDWERCPNPSTGVDRLVQRILRAAQPEG